VREYRPKSIQQVTRKESGVSSVADARRSYIRAELDALDVKINQPLGALFLEELEFALYPPNAHEGKVAPYGSIITRDPDITHYCDRQPITVVDLGNLAHNREAADGLSSFVWRALGESPAASGSKVICFEAARYAGELTVFTLRDDALSQREENKSPEGTDDFIVIQRTSTGVRLMCREGVIDVRNNLWGYHPYSYGFKLDDLVEQAWPTHTKLPPIARGISRLAVHLLSPAGIGATLVWLVEPCADELLNCGRAVHYVPTDGDRYARRGLEVRGSRAEHWAIASILSQRDGVALISIDGKVLSANVFLNLPKNENEKPSDGGTRQRSAREASRQVKGVIVTVSSDGPVRAFYGGEMRLSTNPQDTKKLVPLDGARAA
jgi:hypothetical protein